MFLLFRLLGVALLPVVLPVVVAHKVRESAQDSERGRARETTHT